MKKRLVLAIFLVPVLVVLTAYIAWPVWVLPVVRVVLAEHEIDLLQADIARPGWRSLTIADMALSYQAADHVATLSSPEITLTYSWPQLLHGQFATVHMPVARLQLVSAAQKELLGAEPLSLPLILPDVLFAQLPLTQLDIDSLQLTLPADAVYQTVTGSLHVTTEQLLLQLASAETSNTELASLMLDFKADRQNRLQLNLRQGNHSVLNVQSQIDSSVKPAQLRGAVTVDLQAGSALLTQLGLLDAGYQLTGNTQLHWQASVPTIIEGDSWQRQLLAGQLLTGELNSQGSFIAPTHPVQGQFDIKAHFLFKDGAVLVSLPTFNVNGVADVTGVSSELAPWIASDTAESLPVQISLTPATQLHLDLAPVALRMEKGAVEMKLGRPNMPLLAQLQLQSLNLQTGKKWRAEGLFKTQLALDQVKHPQLSVRALAFAGAGQASLTAADVRVQFEAGSSLQGNRIKLQDSQIDRLDINFPRVFELALQGQKLTVPELELHVGATALRWQDQGGQFAAASLRVKEFVMDWQNKVQVSAAIDSQLTGLQLATGDLQLKPLALQGSWKFSENTLHGTLALKDASGVWVVNGQLRHNLDSGHGSLSSQLQELAFRQRDSYLPKLFTRWPYPFDLFAGQLQMNSTLSWTAAAARVKARVQLNDVGGFYDTNLFYGLNTEWRVDAPLDNLKVVAKYVKIRRLQAAIPIKNVTFSLQLSPDRLQVTDFQAELLGGQVSQNLVSYDWTQDKNELLLQLHNIQLSDLLALELGIEGYGTLDGQLPLKITREGVTLAGGRLQARAPGGVIKYQGGSALSSAAANVGVAFALDALQNFHFEVLDIQADYAENGEMQLQVTLQGRNPDLQEQRPVRFNLNIRENIPALVKSLKLTEDIGDDIERRLKALYEKNNRK